MLGNLVNGNKIYLLDKDNMLYQIGVVEKIAKTPSTNFNPLQPLQENVDLTVRAWDESLDFKNIPSNLSIAACGSIILSDNVEEIIGKIEAIRKEIDTTLQSIESLRQRSKKAEKILIELNPQFRKEKEREEKITKLEGELVAMKEQLNKLITKKGGQS